MAQEDVVFLLDCDGTLFDADQFAADLSVHMERELGSAIRDRYWGILEETRVHAGFTDYLEALRQCWFGQPPRPELLRLSSYLLGYPFTKRLYPGALDAIAHLDQWGPTVILSDGDVVFQSWKLQRCGLWEVVSGRVLIFTHKDRMLDTVGQAFPAAHYVMVDDKLRVLADMKDIWGDRLTTVAVRQGYFAAESAGEGTGADLTLARIGELAACEIGTLSGEPASRSPRSGAPR